MATNLPQAEQGRFSNFIVLEAWVEAIDVTRNHGPGMVADPGRRLAPTVEDRAVRRLDAHPGTTDHLDLTGRVVIPVEAAAHWLTHRRRLDYVIARGGAGGVVYRQVPLAHAPRELFRNLRDLLERLPIIPGREAGGVLRSGVDRDAVLHFNEDHWLAACVGVVFVPA